MSTPAVPARSAVAGRLPLVALVLLLMGSAWLLLALAGPPRLPDRPSDGSALLATLAGSSLPLAPLASLVVTLAWLIWAWLVASVMVELGLAL
ncbi:MAG: hypothetical protein JO023_05810, partial [Chloroflexi bacterium]|nr:hypothetical protein [Chloroflexota bacterium]